MRNAKEEGIRAAKQQQILNFVRPSLVSVSPRKPSLFRASSARSQLFLPRNRYDSSGKLHRSRESTTTLGVSRNVDETEPDNSVNIELADMEKIEE